MNLILLMTATAGSLLVILIKLECPPFCVRINELVSMSYFGFAAYIGQNLKSGILPGEKNKIWVVRKFKEALQILIKNKNYRTVYIMKTHDVIIRILKKAAENGDVEIISIYPAKEKNYYREAQNIYGTVNSLNEYSAPYFIVKFKIKKERKNEQC